MSQCRSTCSVRMASLARVCLAVLTVACGGADAQEAEGLIQPLWMPHPPRYLDRPMTEAEYQACLRRTDVPKWGPIEHPVSETPPADRRLLEEAVSAEISGTVVDAMKALMAQSKREWLVSIRSDSADKVSQFSAKDVPLWQALDKLLEAYGCDWGFAHGAVVCWPALSPPRARPETPEAISGAEAASLDTTPLEVPNPTSPDAVLDHFRPVRERRPAGGETVYLDRRVAVDVRLRDWKLVGRVAGSDQVRGIRQAAAALTAVVQGTPQEGAICMGAHMWLDRAMRGADALEARLRAEGGDLGDAARRTLQLQDRLRALLTAQQWSLMDIGGEAVIWFRELPLDVAELWVVTAKAGEADWVKASPPDRDWSIDWSRPDDFLVTAFYRDIVEQSPDDHLYRVVGRRLGILPVVAHRSGGGRGI